MLISRMLRLGWASGFTARFVVIKQISCPAESKVSVMILPKRPVEWLVIERTLSIASLVPPDVTKIFIALLYTKINGK